MTYRTQVNIKDTGLEVYRLYEIEQVAGYLLSWTQQFGLPTEWVISEPRFVVPMMARIWHTCIEGDRVRVTKIVDGKEMDLGYCVPHYSAVEIYDSVGDDGHTEYRFMGMVIFSEEDIPALVNRPHPWKKGEMSSIADAVEDKMRELEAEVPWEKKNALRSARQVEVEALNKTLQEVRSQSYEWERKAKDLERRAKQEEEWDVLRRKNRVEERQKLEKQLEDEKIRHHQTGQALIEAKETIVNMGERRKKVAHLLCNKIREQKGTIERMEEEIERLKETISSL